MWIPRMVVGLPLLIGCAQKTPPIQPSPSNPPLVDPATFADWPRAMEQPVRMLPDISAFCRPVSTEESQAHAEKVKAKGPHGSMPIRVRVSPDHFLAFQNGQPLPAGTVIVKEKWQDHSEPKQLLEYGLMIKREKGYYPESGDWEYAFVTLFPEKKETRGRMAECADCHGQARDKDYLFRNYLQKKN